MKITVTDGNSIYTFEVDANEQVENIKALVEVETGVPSNRLNLLHQGRVLEDRQRLNEQGIGEGELLFITLAQPKQTLNIADMIKNFDKSRKQSGDFLPFREKSVEQFMKSAEQTYNQLKDDQFRLSQLAETQPEIASLILNKDIRGIAQYLRKKNNERAKRLHEEQKKFLELSKDPMNPEYQRMLEQRIQQENIDKNLEYAQEYIPEIFGQINMLYINASINKVPIQAFVDTGAQSTIMSQSLAERCNLMRLVDKRASGVAMGVGTCKILGKIHAAQIQIEGKFITCAFTVIENNAVEFLLGLDMLKRFNCLVDLKKNILNFNDGMIVTKFLSDGEINRNKRAPTKDQLEEKVKKITSMGFSKDDALRALKSCNYNEEVASNMLMQNKFGQ